MNKNFFQLANRVGIFLALLFAVCFAWYYLRPVEQELHLSMFRLAYFGFEDMNFASFIWGAVQSYLWAYAGVALWQITALFARK